MFLLIKVAKREELIRQLKQKNLMLEEKQKDADERVCLLLYIICTGVSYYQCRSKLYGRDSV